MAMPVYSHLASIPTATSSPIDSTARGLIQTLKDEFAAAGLVQTADTGQADPSTLTVSGSTATGSVNGAGYLIYRFSDAEQDQFPVFIRFDINWATQPGAMIKVTVGVATNGAGTIAAGDIIAGPFQLYGSSGSVQTPVTNDDLRSQFSAEPGRFTMALWPANTVAGSYAAAGPFTIERDLGLDGVTKNVLHVGYGVTGVRIGSVLYGSPSIFMPTAVRTGGRYVNDPVGANAMDMSNQQESMARGTEIPVGVLLPSSRFSRKPLKGIIVVPAGDVQATNQPFPFDIGDGAGPKPYRSSMRFPTGSSGQPWSGLRMAVRVS